MDFLLVYYSLGLLNCDKYGCFNASTAVILLFGLNWSIFVNISNASVGISLLNHYLRDFGLVNVNDSIIVKATSLLSDYMSFLDGFPTNERILYSWFNVEFPGKIGLPISSSAKMHPILQISADFS